MTDKADLGTVVAAARRERFEVLYAEHRARVLGYVLRRTERADDAADVVAETFLVAWRRLDDAPTADVRPWLYGVARRVLANHRRGERRRTQLADQLRSDLAGRDPAPAGEGEFAELAAAFRSLPDGDREVLALEGWEQLDAGEIAVVLGCSRNAARIRLHRARRRLRAAVAASKTRSEQPPMDLHPTTASPLQIGEVPVKPHPDTHRQGLQRAAETIVARDVIAIRGENS
jgi:RNA polymerase sigma-70 factor, ECF subfamily